MSYTVRISNRLLAADSKTDTGFLHQLQKPSSNGWKRSDRYNFGNWEAYFTLTLRDKVNLRNCFANWLGAHVEERVGGRVRWAGMIYRMTYTYKGVVREIGLENMYNAVAYRTEGAAYGDPGGYSSFLTHQRSIDRYGRKEKILDMRQQSTLTTTPARYINNFLAQHALPSVRVVGKEAAGSNLENALGSILNRLAPSVKLVKPKTGQNEMLGIECVGYSQTLNWVHKNSLSTVGDADAAIATLAADVLNYSGVARITPNTTKVLFSEEYRPNLHLIQEIVSIGSATSARMRFTVDPAGNPIYKAAETEPTLYLRDEKFYDSAFAAEAISPRLITPGLVRDMNWPFKATKFASGEVNATDVLNLTDADFYIDQIEVAPDDSFTWTVATDDQNAAAEWNYGY